MQIVPLCRRIWQFQPRHDARRKAEDLLFFIYSLLGIEHPVAAFSSFVETRLMATVCLARCGQLPMIAF